MKPAGEQECACGTHTHTRVKMKEVIQVDAEVLTKWINEEITLDKPYPPIAHKSTVFTPFAPPLAQTSRTHEAAVCAHERVNSEGFTDGVHTRVGASGSGLSFPNSENAESCDTVLMVCVKCLTPSPPIFWRTGLNEITLCSEVCSNEEYN